MNNESSRAIVSILMSIAAVFAAIVCIYIINNDSGADTAIVYLLGMYIGYRVRDSLSGSGNPHAH